jgi:two-component system NarL family response regulator
VVRDGLAAIVNQQADMQVVAEAGDGAEALDLYEQHQPDVMVLDLRMPKLDGAAVVQKVLEKHPKACLLIMTTYDGDEDIFRSLSQGAKGYLLKDAPRQEILSAIRAVADDRPYTSSGVAAKALQRMSKPSLTTRELDVLQLVAEGRPTRTCTSARNHRGHRKDPRRPSSRSSMPFTNRGRWRGVTRRTHPSEQLTCSQASRPPMRAASRSSDRKSAQSPTPGLALRAHSRARTGCGR